MATPGEMSHLMMLQGPAREKFAKQLAHREERPAVCVGCGRRYVSMRERERFCSSECCVNHFAKNPGQITVTAATLMHSLSDLPLQPPAQENALCTASDAATLPIYLCGWCDAEFRAGKPNAKFCSDKCRVAAHRHKGKCLRERCTICNPPQPDEPIVMENEESNGD